MPKSGPVGYDERARYRERLPNDTEWGRPTAETAAKVCALLDVDPIKLRAARDRGEAADRTAAQAFTVALDAVIAVGDRGAQLTYNSMFDAVGRYWSLRYRAAQARGAEVSYDMAEATLLEAHRELLAAGVNLDAIWTLLIRPSR